MKKNKAGVSLFKRFLFIGFSLLLSCLLWFYVSINEKQSITLDLNGIVINYTGQESLEENNLIVTNKDAEKLNLRVSGKRLTVAKLDKENVTVVCDMRSITTPGTHYLNYTIDFGAGVNSAGIEIVSSSANYTMVTVKRLISAEIPVHASYDGDVETGYKRGAIEFSPSTIEISGPQDEVEQIEDARVVLSGSRISQTLSGDVTLELYKKDGSVFESDNILCSQNSIHVVQLVSMVKEIPLDVNLVAGAGADESNSIVTIEPASITVSGDPAILQDINRISLGTIDLSSFQESYGEEKPIVLPDDVINDTGLTTAKINVRVVGLDTTKLSVSDIRITDEPAAYSTQVITQTMDITLRGDAKQIAMVTANDIRIEASLADVSSEGAIEVKAKVLIDNYPDIGAIGSYKVNVRLTKN